MRPVVARRDGKPLDELRFSGGQPVRTLLAVVDRAINRIDPRRADQRIDIRRIKLHRPVEKLAGAHDVCRSALVEGRDAPEIEVHRVGIGLALRTLRFDVEQFGAQLVGEAGDDLVLHVEQVGDRLVKPVGP